MNGLNILSNVMQCSALLVDILQQQPMAMQVMQIAISSKLCEILLLTVTQANAQKGHREGDDERNPGNVRKFLQFTAKHDPIVADCVKSGPKNEK